MTNFFVLHKSLSSLDNSAQSKSELAARNIFCFWTRALSLDAQSAARQPRYMNRPKHDLTGVVSKTNPLLSFHVVMADDDDDSHLAIFVFARETLRCLADVWPGVELD